MEKILIPMKFYNLTTHTEEEYDVNIVEEFDFITRVDIDMPNVSENQEYLLKYLQTYTTKTETASTINSSCCRTVN